MAEVKKLIAFMNARGLGNFAIEEGLVGGCCYDAHKVAITDATMAKAHAADADLRRGRRPALGSRAVRGAAGGRALAPAQGTRLVRQYSPRHLLSCACRILEPQARSGGWARHHHPA